MKLFNFEEVIQIYPIVLVVSRDCDICHNMLKTLTRCQQANHKDIAVVSNYTPEHKFSFDNFKTSTEHLKKISGATPTIFLKQKKYRIGAISCRELVDFQKQNSQK